MLLGSARVVIVHDYATQRGGAERVALDLLRAFPGSRLVTSVWNADRTFPEFRDFSVEVLALNRHGLFRDDPRRAFPLLAKAFGRHLIEDADVVICSSSGWSHRVITAAPKIVYCHNPARWLYQPDDYLSSLPRWARRRFVSATEGLRRSDLVAARTATRYLANSSVVSRRIQHAYGRSAEVIHPARGLSPEGPCDPVAGLEPGFLLTVGRARGYKNAAHIADAVASIPGERLVIVGDVERRQPRRRVTTLSRLSDEQLRWLFHNAGGLVAVAHEDFGLTVVEAQAFGLPALVLRAGGYLDSGVEGSTCVFADSLDPAAISAGIAELRRHAWDAEKIVEFGDRYSPHSFVAAMRRVAEDVLVERSQHTEGGHLRAEHRSASAETVRACVRPGTPVHRDGVGF